ncbi:hypothetical protein [Flavobacterium cerinum]|uniref:DUF4280 domain-containing protein n=1 Tax=Flavobacterium cerinum TaxID=2502784 RepID=A0ABY5IVU4_9FLAO|nr:hypothetical protein [Flavobacterium cerinum]UUC45576.1 hypothetical protein NOX80_18390 [Flavobacterium cerinum]
MKFKKPSGGDIGTSFASVGAGVASGFGSRAIIDAATKPAIELAPTKKELNAKMLGQGLAVVLGLSLVAATSGNDSGAHITKGAGVGMAVVNAIDFAATYTKRNDLLTTNTAASRVLRSGLGLGCPCNSPAEQRYYPALAQPIIDPMEGMTMAERVAYRDAMLGKNSSNPLLQVNENAWQTAIAS